MIQQSEWSSFKPLSVSISADIFSISYYFFSAQEDRIYTPDLFHTFIRTVIYFMQHIIHSKYSLIIRVEYHDIRICTYT